RLPELFAGYERNGEEPPGMVPTSARPQAWAAGTPVLLLRALLGLEPDPAARALRVSSDAMPAWAEGLELAGVRAFGRRWNVQCPDVDRIEEQRLPVTDVIGDHPDDEPHQGHRARTSSSSCSTACSDAAPDGTTRTGQRASCTTAVETLRCRTRLMGLQPCAPMTIIRAPRELAT